MALQTKTFTVGVVGDLAYNRFALDLILTENSVSNLHNTSEISFVLQLRSGSRSFSGYGLGAEVKLGGTVVASRNQLTEPRMSIGENSTLTILSGTVDIPHNADGALDMPVAFWINTPVESYTPGYMESAGTMTLTSIPRASAIKATDAYIGQRSTLAITRHSPSYTHSVRYVFGDQSGYVSSSGQAVAQEEKFSDTSLGFLLPDSFYEEIPNDPYGAGTLTVTTYAGDTPIGQESAKFKAYADPADCAPEATFSAKDINPKTLAITQDENTFIRGCSTVQCQVSAQGQKGARVTSVLVNGREELEFTAVADALELTVTDSRGYTTRKTITPTMLDYVMLTCHASARREAPTSDRVHIAVTGQHYTAGFPGADNQLRLVAVLPDGTQMDIPYTESDNAYTGELILEVPYQQSCVLTVQAADDLTQISEQVNASRGLPVFDWGENDFAFHVPVTFAEGQTTLRYGLAPYGFDPDEAADNSLLWYYHEDHPEKAGILLTLSPYPGNVVFQIACGSYGENLKYRTRWNYVWYDWHTLA